MDELNAPLGQSPSPKRRFPIATLAAPALLGVVAAAVVLWPMVMHEQPTGTPAVDAPPTQPVADARTTQQTAKTDAPDHTASVATPQPPAQTVTIIDGQSGKQREVVIGISGEARRRAGDPRLLEPSRHGMIPRIAVDGQRPSDVYAQKPAADRRNPDGPQIAIVISGLGVSTNATANALAKLPAAVTLGFTPYGSDLDISVSQAREKGHEVLLQVPMEPQDYPDNDPGPNTLLSSLPAEQNVDRLQWLFSRMQGYVGVTNVMGARFTATDNALAPVLRELSKRGLMYVDDGSSSQSLAGQIAGVNKQPYAKADVVIDANPSAADIDAALKRLESTARNGGVVVGYASALPGTIERIAKWAKAAQARGIVLIPITAAAARARST